MREECVQQRCLKGERAFRVDESVLDDPGDGQRTVSRRRERHFILKKALRVGESAGDGQGTADGRPEGRFA